MLLKNPSSVCLPLSRQYLRDKCWVKGKGCFIQEARSLESWPSPKFQTKQKSFKREAGERGLPGNWERGLCFFRHR